MQQGRKVNGNCLRLRERNGNRGVMVNNLDGLFMTADDFRVYFLSMNDSCRLGDYYHQNNNIVATLISLIPTLTKSI